MRLSNVAEKLLVMVPLGLLLGCGGSTGESTTEGTGGKGTGGTSASGGVVSSGGVVGSGGAMVGTGGATQGTGGTTVKGSGGAIEGTGGTTVKGSGGAVEGTGGSTVKGTGGTTATALGGTTTSGSGGTTGLGNGGATGRPTGGSTGTGNGGATGTANGGSTGTAGTSGGYLPGNPAVQSAGCGKALPSAYKAGAETTFKDMTSAGLKREYIVYVPTGYDSSKPYKLLFAWHCMGSSDTGAVNSGYYGAKQNDTGKTTILVAPQGYTDGSPWRGGDDKDHIFFDDMLKLFKADLCVDESRVFSIGFSFGGMETYSLSVNRQKDIRAGVGIAPANWNIYVTKTKSHLPIAWMQTTGMGDGTCPWVQGSSTTNGAKYIAIEHATDNGCTSPSTMTTWQSGAHVCFDYAGCKAGYPTKICTFNGGHTDNNSDSGGGGNWIYSEAWKFFSQF